MAKKKTFKKKVRNPYVPSAMARKAGTHKDKRNGRGGAKNNQPDLLAESNEEPKPIKDHKLYITFRESIEVTDESDDWKEEHFNIEFTDVYQSQADAKLATCHKAYEHYQAVKTTKEVYNTVDLEMVVVIYNSGSTFGREYGRWHVEGIYISGSGEAQSVAKSIEDGTYISRKCAWEGFFEELVCVEIRDL